MRKRRPAIIGSKKHKGCCLVCPIISTNRKFTTYIEIKNPKKIDGKVVTHQL
nr:type II toxin-antitoxin system PemK/MazF family toxin [Enterococcus spodopteracolus]